RLLARAAVDEGRRDHERPAMNQIVVVTGAGSGVGRAVAIALARESWNLALVGRTEAHLRETIQLATQSGANSKFVACPGDIADEASVAEMARRVQRELGEVDVLVNNAGT